MEEQKLTGFPSVDKPWLNHYPANAINAPAPEGSLYEHIYRMNKDHLNDTALDYFGTKVTFRTLFDRIDQTANAFAALGVRAGDAVTLVTLSCVNSVVCLYALNRLGAVSNYINVLSSQEELEHYYRDAESRFVVTLDLFGDKAVAAAKAAGVEKVVVYSLSDWMPPVTKAGFQLQMRKLDKSFLKDPICLSWKDFLRGGRDTHAFFPKKDPDSTCCLAHTGGTTGFPKTVLISDRAMNIIAQQYDLTIQHSRQDVFLSVMIPFVLYGCITNIHMPLSLGLKTVLIPKFDAADWHKYIRKYRPQHFAGIPPYVAPMPDDPKLANMDLSCLTTFGLGGDGLNAALEQQINDFLAAHGCKAEIVKGYGMTEVCATAVTSNPYANKQGSVGIPLPTVSVMAYDNDAQRELPYNEVGEICLQSKSQMLGYKDAPEEMKNLIHVHPDGSRWIHTGDLGYVDEEGFLFLIGRMKRIILTSRDGVAYKVYPNIPEEVLTGDEAVHTACIVSAPQGSDLVLKAYLTLHPQHQGTEAETEARLRSLCEKELAENSRPTFYEFRETLPLTPAGKVDFRVLEQDAQKT